MLNTLSFTLLAGNIITLYLLRLGASGSLIGLVSSFGYLSLLFVPFGRLVVPRLGVVNTFAAAWLARYVAVMPMLFSPVLAARGDTFGAVLLVIIGYLAFHAFRGIGIISNSPIVANLADGRDRGTYLAMQQIIMQLTALATGLVIALLLEVDAPLSRFSQFLAAGIVFGFAAAVVIARMPAIPQTPPGDGDGRLRATMRRIATNPTLRRFFIAFGVFAFFTSIIRPFVLVYAKQVVGVADNTAVYFTIVGNLGAIAMGLVTRLVLDKLGAKPVWVIFTALGLLVNAAMVAMPPFEGPLMAAYLAAVFFFVSFALVGADNAGQTYFYSIIDPKDQINLGMVFFVLWGVAGAAGSSVGGVMIDALRSGSPTEPAWVFRVFFALTLATFVPVLIALSRIERLGARSVAKALATMVSIRDLRAITLINRLDETIDIADETAMLRRIGRSHSDIGVATALRKLQSPVFSVRTEALYTLENLPLNRDVEEALVDHIATNPFGTAHTAARIAGRRAVERAIPALRHALLSDDYVLVARAALALAELNDRVSVPRIEALVDASDNPFVLLHSITAIRVFGDPRSVPHLLHVLHRPVVPPFVREEIVVALSYLLNFSGWFYPVFGRFLEDHDEGVALLRDKAETQRFAKTEALGRRALWSEITTIDQPPSAIRSALIERVLPKAADIGTGLFADAKVFTAVCENLLAAIDNPVIARFERFRFLAAAFAVEFWNGLPAKPNESQS